MSTINFDEYEDYIDQKSNVRSGGKRRPNTSKTSKAARTEAILNAKENRVSSAIDKIKPILVSLYKKIPEPEQFKEISNYVAWVNICLDSDVYIDDKDIKIDTFQSGGPGGQNVNKVSSGARATHTLSKISCESTESRNQPENIKFARSRLEQELTDHINDWRIVLSKGDSEGKPQQLTPDTLSSILLGH